MLAAALNRLPNLPLLISQRNVFLCVCVCPFLFCWFSLKPRAEDLSAFETAT